MRYFLFFNMVLQLSISGLRAQTGTCAGSLEFLSQNSAVHYPPSGATQYYSSNGFTWESWVKLTTPFSNYSSSLLRPIFCVIDPVAYEDICLSFGWSGGVGNVSSTHLCFKVDGPNSSTGASNVSCDYIPTGGFTLGTWYHVAATMDYANHTAKLYLNGVLVDTKTVNSAPMIRTIPTQLSWDIASNPGYANPPLGGNMDEVRIWSVVRTPADIATYYNQCLAGNEPDLVSYFRCNQTSGTTALDATANGLNGNLVNGAAWSAQQPPLIGANCSIGCCPLVSAGNDTTICPGMPAQLNSSAGFATYTWTPSAGLNNSNIQNPVATPTVTTSYIVSATYTNSGVICTSTDTVLVSVYNSLALSTPSYTVCNGQSVTITPVVSGGNGGYTYNWGNGYANSTFVYTPSSDSVYSVTVTDANGCTTPLSSGNITLLPPLAVTVNGASVCTGDLVHLLANASGGNGNYSFSWSPSGATGNPLNILAPSNTTVYTVTVSDGCSVINAVDTVLVTVTPAPIIILPPPVSGCAPVCIDLSSVSYAGLSAWQWDYGNGTISNSQNGLYCYNKTGAYSISFSYTTTLGCIKTASANNLVTVFPQPVAAFTPSASETDITNAQITFLNQSQNYSGSQWWFGSQGVSSLQNPQYTYQTPGTYPVTLVVTNNHGCYDTVIHEITIYDVFTFYAPTAFSPDYDGDNDLFLPMGTGWDDKSFKMEIYDRWGNLVVSTTDPYQGWDGTLKGKELQQDVYAWKIELKDNLGQDHQYYGTLSLLK